MRSDALPGAPAAGDPLRRRFNGMGVSENQQRFPSEKIVKNV
jgi:hypothetical protein